MDSENHLFYGQVKKLDNLKSLINEFKVKKKVT